MVLDQNYRSTGSILNIANVIITSAGDSAAGAEPAPEDGVQAASVAKMPHRKLWTAATDDVPVTCCVFGSDDDEALYVADQIPQLVKGD